VLKKVILEVEKPPDTPTKLYNDTRVKEGEFSVHRLPNKETAAVSVLGIFLIVFSSDLHVCAHDEVS